MFDSLFAEARFSDVVPLRAIAFQVLYLLVAIAIESFILRQYLVLDHKVAVRYAATLNLLATCVGWLIFFATEPFLPTVAKEQIISFVFFEQFVPNIWVESLSSIVIFVSFLIFLGTFLLKWQGLNYLEVLLGKAPSQNTTDPTKEGKYRGWKNQIQGIQVNPRFNATFVANALSFTAILGLLFLRMTKFYPLFQ